MRARHTFSAIVILAFLQWFAIGVANAAQKNAATVPASEPAEPKPAAAAPVAPTAPTVVPLADIATKATEVSNLIANLTAGAAASAQIENISRSLPAASEKLHVHFTALGRILKAEPTLDTLQNLQQEWQRREVSAKGSLNALTAQATKLQDALNQLNDQEKLWIATRASAQAAKAPDPIVQQIDATLASISAAQEKLSSERTAMLDLQSRVAEGVTICAAALAQIGQVQSRAVAGILVPDAPPIWRVESWPATLKVFPEIVRKLAAAHWSDIEKYIGEQLEEGFVPGALFIVLALVFSAARRKISTVDKSAGVAASAILVFERPYSAALATVFIYLTSPFFPMPVALRQLLTIVALVPILRLVRPMMSVAAAALIYGFCFLFAVDTVRQTFAGGLQAIGQAFLFAETLAAIIMLLWRRHYYQQLVATRAESSGVMFLKLAQWLLMMVLVVGLVSAMSGYMRLARLLTPGVFVGVVLALAGLTMLRVAGGVVVLALRVWPLRSLKMVEHYGDYLERRIYRWLVWLTVLAWVVRYLNYLGLLDNAWSVSQAVLATKLERGTISISLGNVLEFFLAIWFAHLLSRFLRFVLQEDVYPRIDLAPGLSYAASSLLNYVILALGFVVALGVLGVDFSKASVIVGAFGVGLGFGLQSIVNNFVSGLILLFERPIHVGDTVEVGKLQGSVRRIGIRASVIHTNKGADIIVPNSQLITDQVTNWTLSDRLRRLDLPVGVNYGSDPEKVIEVLERVARGHPDVLPEPAPRALFRSYGDSSINFELRVWPRQFNKLAQVTSDLASAVYHAINDAGMSFPFPQREVRILRDGDTALPAKPINQEKKSQ
jgi:small-conductance mechanosensitive channel